MARTSKRIDKVFLAWALALIVFGFLIFNSASLGLLARGGDRYANVAFSQTFYGLFMGSLALLITLNTPYKLWKKFAFYIFVGACILTSLVFVPGLGFEHGGATRWILIGPFSFQPSEFLKIAFIIYLAAWIAGVRDKVKTVRFGLLPLLIILGVCGGLLLSQPDTDTFLVIAASGVAMYLVGGGKWRHVVLLSALGLMGLLFIIYSRPYLQQRVTTFLDPTANALSSSYQIQQSLIAVGSGGLTGRGFGQSIQKFNFLPEPIGDSVFAVAAEEFGFVGSVFLIILFVGFSIQGLKIAARTNDLFGRLLVVGIVILIVTQSFINMGSMLGVLPVTGIPLPFVSHGGTALLITLAQVGIVLHISKYGQKT